MSADHYAAFTHAHTHTHIYIYTYTYQEITTVFNQIIFCELRATWEAALVHLKHHPEFAEA